jgi:hypothetical protein
MFSNGASQMADLSCGDLNDKSQTYTNTVTVSAFSKGNVTFHEVCL